MSARGLCGLVLATAAMLSACGGPTYEAECDARCQDPPADICTQAERNDCDNQCLSLTGGRSEECADCILEHSRGPGVGGTCTALFANPDEACPDECGG